MIKEVVIPEVTVEWVSRIPDEHYRYLSDNDHLVDLSLDAYEKTASIKPLKDDQISYKEADELFYAFKEYDLIFILTYDGKYWRFSIPEESGQHFMEGHDSFIDCLEDALKKGHRVYQFSTQKELFIWGAEQLS